MGTKQKMKRGWKRLLKLADILDVADAEHKRKGEPTYDQSELAHPCGSPACAVGHYIAHRRGWVLQIDGTATAKSSGEQLHGRHVLQDLDIAFDEYMELFGPSGCDNAGTAKKAARYIRKFVGRKLKSAV